MLLTLEFNRCAGYVRVYTEELNKQRRRELEAIKAAELRQVKYVIQLYNLEVICP